MYAVLGGIRDPGVCWSVAVRICALIATSVPAQAADSFAGAFKEGKAGLAFRYRFEGVDQDSFDKDAKVWEDTRNCRNRACWLGAVKKWEWVRTEIRSSAVKADARAE